MTTTPEAGLRGVSDEEQVRHASASGRVLFTQDRDFLRMTTIPHAGISYCDKDTREVGSIIEALVLLWEVYDPEEMTGRIEFL